VSGPEVSSDDAPGVDDKQEANPPSRMGIRENRAHRKGRESGTQSAQRSSVKNLMPQVIEKQSLAASRKLMRRGEFSEIARLNYYPFDDATYFT